MISATFIMSKTYLEMFHISHFLPNAIYKYIDKNMNCEDLAMCIMVTDFLRRMSFPQTCCVSVNAKQFPMNLEATNREFGWVWNNNAPLDCHHIYCHFSSSSSSSSPFFCFPYSLSISPSLFLSVRLSLPLSLSPTDGSSYRGLSMRRGHYNGRSDCLNYFAKSYNGTMPLIYTHSKVAYNDYNYYKSW